MKITMATDYETQDGKKVKADAKVDLPADEARNLLFLGMARLDGEAPKPATTETKKEA